MKTKTTSNDVCRCGKPATFKNNVRAFCEPCRQRALDNWNREVRGMNLIINPKGNKKGRGGRRNG